MCQQLVQSGSNLQQPGTETVVEFALKHPHKSDERSLNRHQKQLNLFSLPLLPLGALLADDGISSLSEVDLPVC